MTDALARPSAAVVGAGWSGLAAAVTLVDAGWSVQLIDMAPSLGGRARGIDLRLAGRALRLDNGQHLIVGAYRETLALARHLGMAATAIERRAMRLQAVDGLRLSPPDWPAPWHLAAALVSARGLDLAARWAMIRLMARLKARRWETPAATPTVRHWLQAQGQPASLQTRLWDPLCVATLNTAPEQACARTFAIVLRDTLGSARAATDFITPRSTLDDIVPAGARAHLTRQGARLYLRTLVRALRAGDAGRGWRLDTPAGHIDADAVVLAVGPATQHRLLASIATTAEQLDLIAPLTRFEHDAIATVYLGWDQQAAPAHADPLMLTEDPQRNAFGQWYFDRGTQAGLRLGAVVVSTRGRREADNPAVLTGIVEQVREQLGLPAPLEAKIVVDKRATFQCTPTRPRVDSHRIDRRPLAWPGIALAGDHAWPDYPATLEAAVRAGIAAADQLIAGRPMGG